MWGQNELALRKCKCAGVRQMLQGLCTAEKCPYLHVNVNPAAPVCQAFLRGYCPDGESTHAPSVLLPDCAPSLAVLLPPHVRMRNEHVSPLVPLRSTARSHFGQEMTFQQAAVLCGEAP